MDKHTAGPWVVGAATGPCSARIETASGRVIGSAIVQNLIAVEKGQAVYEWSAEGEANARLFAGSLALLLAARKIAHCYSPESGNLYHDVTRAEVAQAWADLNAAIAKVNGESA